MRPAEGCKNYKELGVAIDLDAFGIADKSIRKQCKLAVEAWLNAHGGDRKFYATHLMDLENNPRNAKKLAQSHVILFGKEESDAYESNELSDSQRSSAPAELIVNMNLVKVFTPEMIDRAKG